MPEKGMDGIGHLLPAIVDGSNKRCRLRLLWLPLLSVNTRHGSQRMLLRNIVILRLHATYSIFPVVRRGPSTVFLPAVLAGPRW